MLAFARKTPLVLAAVVLAGCQLATSADTNLTSQVTVSPAEVVAGDTVHLLVSTTNHGSTAVEAGAGCGPGLGFEITRPDGSRIDPFQGLVFTCELKDSNVLEPGETDTVRFAWRTPEQRGEYRVRGGVWMGSGLRAPSSAQRFTVR